MRKAFNFFFWTKNYRTYKIQKQNQFVDVLSVRSAAQSVSAAKRLLLISGDRSKQPARKQPHESTNNAKWSESAELRWASCQEKGGARGHKEENDIWRHRSRMLSVNFFSCSPAGHRSNFVAELTGCFC